MHKPNHSSMSFLMHLGGHALRPLKIDVTYHVENLLYIGSVSNLILSCSWFHLVSCKCDNIKFGTGEGEVVKQ